MKYFHDLTLEAVKALEIGDSLLHKLDLDIKKPIMAVPFKA